MLKSFEIKASSTGNPTNLGTPDGVFKPYPKAPKPLPLSITQDIVELGGAKLSGATGPGGTDG